MDIVPAHPNWRRNDENSNVLQALIDDFFNALLDAKSPEAINDAFGQMPYTQEEKKLLEQLQSITKTCEMFPEARCQFIALCSRNSIDTNTISGSLINTCHEKSFLVTAQIKSNLMREASYTALQKAKELITKVYEAVEDERSHSRPDIAQLVRDAVSGITELAQNPSTVFAELSKLQVEKQQYLKIISNVQPFQQTGKAAVSNDQDTKAAIELKKKVRYQETEITRLKRQLDKTEDEKVEKNGELERLIKELGKMNALKHENGQLKKKLANLTPSKGKGNDDDVVQMPSKKKVTDKTSDDISGGVEGPVLAAEPSSCSIAEHKSADMARALLLVELDSARGRLRDIEVRLKQNDNAKDEAVQRLRQEQSKSQKRQEASESHRKAIDALRAELDQLRAKTVTSDQSISRAKSSLTNAEHFPNRFLDKQDDTHHRPALESKHFSSSNYESRSSSWSFVQRGSSPLECSTRDANSKRQIATISDRGLEFANSKRTDRVVNSDRRLNGATDPFEIKTKFTPSVTERTVTPAYSCFASASSQSTQGLFAAKDVFVASKRTLSPRHDSSFQSKEFRISSRHGLTDLDFPLATESSSRMAVLKPELTGRVSKTSLATTSMHGFAFGATRSGSFIGNGAIGVDWGLWAR